MVKEKVDAENSANVDANDDRNSDSDASFFSLFWLEQNGRAPFVVCVCMRERNVPRSIGERTHSSMGLWVCVCVSLVVGK